MCSDNFCILALGSGQRLLYRLESGIGLVSVLVLRFCTILNVSPIYLFITVKHFAAADVVCSPIACIKYDFFYIIYMHIFVFEV